MMRTGTRTGTGALALVLAVPLLALGARQGATPTGDVAALERALTDAWASGAQGQLDLVRGRIAACAERHPAAARAHYLAGLAALIDSLATNGSPDRTDPALTLERVGQAEQHLARAFELDAGEADACAASAFCALQRATLGQPSADLGARMDEWLQRGQAAAPERCSVQLLAGWLEAGRALGSPASAAQALGELARFGERVRAGVQARGGEPDFWELFAQCMVARAHLFAPRPQPHQAARLVEALRAQRPGVAMVERFLGPFVGAHEPLAPEAWQDLEWSELGSEPDPDGAVAGLADAVVAELARAGDDLWLRVFLAEPADLDLFGVNVVIDRDGSPETGLPWWGGSSGFVFDRLVSVWVARDDEGRYRGAVGLTDAAGAMQGEMCNLGPAHVAFGFEPGGEAVVVRVQREALGGESARFLLAVGSNAQWNDNLPDAGGFALAR